MTPAESKAKSDSPRQQASNKRKNTENNDANPPVGKKAFLSDEKSAWARTSMDYITETLIDNNMASCPIYASSSMQRTAPKKDIPDLPMNPKIAQQLIRDELSLDGNPKLNMATFVTTFMDKEAEELMAIAMKKNFIDMDEYEQTTELHNRCVSMLARLYHAPELPENVPYTGTGCVGSSEAIMLSILAMKWRWRDRRRAQGKSTDRPNIVCGSNVQVCWHKACRYFEVECREAPVSPDCLVLTAERARPLIDENTIGVCAILGSTFNGEFEDVKGIHDMVQELNKKNNWDVPIHVDAASGGFIAPFIQPDLVWDFRLPGVKSINVSGHKFGLVYAGIGWALWREPKDLPADLVFHVNYLGGDQASFTLNFSKGASTIIGQYYNLIRLGRQGYTAIMQASMKNAQYLRDQLVKMGRFKIVDTQDMPLVAFTLKDRSHFSEFDIQDRMRHNGWIIPAYTCSKGAESLTIMRVVVKQNFSHDFADILIRNLREAIEHLEQLEKTKQVLLKEGDSAVRHFKAALATSKATKKLLRHSHSTMESTLQHRFQGERTSGVC